MLGHAGLLINYKNINILIDPWFDNAFLGGWHPYPYNKFLKSSILKTKIDYIYISHAHEDHFSVEFLSLIDKNIPVLIAKFKGTNLINRLKKLEFKNIREIEHNKIYNINNNIKIKIIMDTSFKEDSSLYIIFDNKYTFLNMNDCNNKLTDLPKNVDVMTCQFAGAMWYPMCYEYDEDVMNKKINEINDGLLLCWKNKINTVKPKIYFPNGGPPCFLHDHALHLNYINNTNTIFFNWKTFYERIKNDYDNIKFFYLEPDDSIINNKMHKSNIFNTIYYDLEWYKKQIILKDLSNSLPNNIIDIKEYFNNIFTNNTEYFKNNEFTQNFIIKTEDNIYTIYLSKNKCLCNEINKDRYHEIIANEYNNENYYLFKMTNQILKEIINYNVDWEEALLSTHINLKRYPDIFDPKFQLYLRHCNYPEQMNTIKAINKNETFIHDSYPNKQIQRWCPHMGEDLKTANVCNGVITCPRHGWAWDINTGDCIKGGNVCLTVKTLDW
tara:strand:- start:833 stop:2323 length:1491 start_codon:yes stop_codon:yes gene_type:complete